MQIVSPERAGEIRAQLTAQHGATWLHHYHEAIEAEVLKAVQAPLEGSADQWHALSRIHDLAHNASTGPAVPDTLWEIRNIAQEAL